MIMLTCIFCHIYDYGLPSLNSDLLLYDVHSHNLNLHEHIFVDHCWTWKCIWDYR